MKNFWRYLLLAVVLFVASLVFIVVRNWDTVSLAWENASAMTEGSEEARTINEPADLAAYLSRHPNTISLAVVSSDGTVQQAHTPEAARPLYRLPHLLLFATASERMHDGRLDSTEQVPLEDIDAFSLPGLTDDAYTEMVDSLRARNLVRGEAIPLKQVVRGMMTYQSPAAADWLMTRLGREVVDGLPEAFGLTGSEAPRPMSGTYVTWLQAREAAGDTLRIESDLGMPPPAYADSVWEATDRLARETAFRESVVGPLAERGTGLSVIQQRNLAAATFPTGTALDYARLLAQVYAGGPNATAIGEAPAGSGWMDMQALLETALPRDSTRQESMRADSMQQAPSRSVGSDTLLADATRTGRLRQPATIANVAGAYPGLLTLGGYARFDPNGGPDRSADDEARVVVLMMTDLPVAVFYQLAQTGIDKGLFLELLLDPSAPERIVSRIQQGEAR